MAIIINSKNIYEKQNQKVRNNFIDTVTLKSKDIFQANEYSVNVLNARFEQKEEWVSYTDDDSDARTYASKDQLMTTDLMGIAYAKLIATYLTCDLYIPILRNNKYVSELILKELQEDGTQKPKLEYTVYGNIVKGNITTQGTITHDFWGVTGYSVGEIKYGEIDSQSTTETLNLETLSKNLYCSISSSNRTGTAIAGVVFKNKTNILTRNYYEATLDGIDYFIVQGLTLLIGTQSYKTSWNGANPYSDGTTKVTMKGTREEYNPVSVQINVYGNLIGIELEDLDFQTGEGTQPFVIEGNELLQSNATIGDEKLHQYLTNKVLNEYKNGKETAEILCDVGEYYNDNGDLEISFRKKGFQPTFEIGDIVIPMVFSAKGTDIPMSKYQDGNPKEFTVVGVEIIYDGAIWQRLTLQEYTKQGEV